MTMGIKRLEPEREDLERIKGRKMRVTLWGLHFPWGPSLSQEPGPDHHVKSTRYRASAHTIVRPLGLRHWRPLSEANVELWWALSTFRVINFIGEVDYEELSLAWKVFLGERKKRGSLVLGVGKGARLEKAKLQWEPGRGEVQKIIIILLSYRS